MNDILDSPLVLFPQGMGERRGGGKRGGGMRAPTKQRVFIGKGVETHLNIRLRILIYMFPKESLTELNFGLLQGITVPVFQ